MLKSLALLSSSLLLVGCFRFAAPACPTPKVPDVKFTKCSGYAMCFDEAQARQLMQNIHTLEGK